MIRENVLFNGFFWYRNVNLINKGYVKNRVCIVLFFSDKFDGVKVFKCW